VSTRIAAVWTAYRERVVPEDASRIQIQETRRAFYAGATALMALLLAHLDPGSEATADDLRMMDELDAELKRFAADIAEGRA